MKLLSPAVLWLLALAPCLIAGYLALHWRRRSSLSFASLDLVRQAMSGAPGFRQHVPAILLLLAAGLALIAVARPVAVVPTPEIERTIILALDTSTSMAAQDVSPSRIDAARAAAKAFIATQPAGARVGILAFSGYADLVQPPTSDHAALLSAIDDLYLQQGTSIGGGLMAALLTLFPQAGFSGHNDLFGVGRSPIAADFGQFDRAAIIGRRSPDARAPGSHPSAAIILLTDGRNRSGPAPLKAAQLAAEHGVRVYTVGVGRAGKPAADRASGEVDNGIDEAMLREIARITQGEYFQAANRPDLERIYRDLHGRVVLTTVTTELTAGFAGAAAVMMSLACGLSLLWSGGVPGPVSRTVPERVDPRMNQYGSMA